MTISISELQKNISTFKNLNTNIKIIDKKTKKILAIILPNREYKKESLTKSLAGSLKNKTEIKIENLDEAIKKAYFAEMNKKLLID